MTTNVKNQEGHITDANVGTEELGHMEMISAMVYQLTRSLCIDEIKLSGFDAYFVDHTNGVYPVSAAGIPFKMDYVASKGDIITDLHEDLAADGATTHGQQIRSIRTSRLPKTICLCGNLQ